MNVSVPPATIAEKSDNLVSELLLRKVVVL